MRLFTALAGSQPMVTINAHDHEEALDALTTLLGEMDGASVRVATPEEALCWNTSATQAGERIGSD
jgi:hypothetical protein